MPIMAVSDHSDMRGSARFLAGATRRYIAEVPDDDRHVPVMNGMYRLIRTYETSGLDAYEYRPNAGPIEDAISPMSAPGRSHAAELRIAMREAIAEAADRGGKGDVVERIKDVLRASATRSGGAEPGAVLIATIFLDALLRRLRAAG